MENNTAVDFYRQKDSDNVPCRTTPSDAQSKTVHHGEGSLSVGVANGRQWATLHDGRHALEVVFSMQRCQLP